MKIPIYQIDAFADGPFKGNPAAVCPLDHWLPDTILQCIAEENNLSETAFFVGNAPEYHLRWFTPNTEVDLCGHATLAAAHVIFDLHPLISTITFHSRSGPLRVAKNNSLLTLDFPSQTLESCQAPDILIQALGIVPQACFRGMDYLAVLPKESDIIELTPNFELLKQLDLRGLIVTAPGTDVDFVSRFFAPNCGINEDPCKVQSTSTIPYYLRVTVSIQKKPGIEQVGSLVDNNERTRRTSHFYLSQDRKCENYSTFQPFLLA